MGSGPHEPWGVWGAEPPIVTGAAAMPFQRRGAPVCTTGAHRPPLCQLGPLTVQNPLMHRFVISQQSAAVVHFSCGAEQVLPGGLSEQVSSPFGPLGWQ